MILGMKIFKISNGISLSLTHNIERMLHKFDFYNSKLISTPYDSSIDLKKNTGEPVFQLKYSQLIDSLLYIQLIGSHLYISNRTRSDISYAVGRLSRYTSSPSREHWTVLERVFRYLRGTIGYCLTYTRYPDVMEVIVMPTGSLIPTVLSLLPDMYSYSVVLLCPENSVNKQ